METSLLNKAHQAGRKAVKLSKQGLYAESALHHIEAAKLFQQLETAISDESLATRSLKEQRQYHQRQAEIAKKIRELADKEKGKIAMTERNGINASQTRQEGQPKQLMDHAIRRNFEEIDSLLQILSDTKTLPQGNEENKGARFMGYSKFPKSDKDVIEELQTVNSNLRSLVSELWEKLRIVQDEKLTLEKRLELYEPKPAPKSTDFTALIDQLPATTPLPELAPLEQPPAFEFS
ncbi:unnamed protein product [Allacma fusca]|uniref:Nuclear receptor-binding factor 2 MIT domain-containing protein n=1 Tax=Allacma fusca TaxID=39272 RepID=A0A8J2JXB5_9HEXA|nr:unnamed protein product [Allacma fusca]